MKRFGNWITDFPYPLTLYVRKNVQNKEKQTRRKKKKIKTKQKGGDGTRIVAK